MIGQIVERHANEKVGENNFVGRRLGERELVLSLFNCMGNLKFRRRAGVCMGEGFEPFGMHEHTYLVTL